jgi:alpha-tubulin suppressor-like RCC1 family protein
MKDGTVKSWGYNGYGQLGDGISGTESDVPVSVKNLTGVKNIDGGLGFALAVTQ